MSNISAIDHDTTLSRIKHPDYELGDGGLTAASFADNSYFLSLFNLETQRFYSLYACMWKGKTDIFKLNCIYMIDTNGICR